MNMKGAFVSHSSTRLNGLFTVGCGLAFLCSLVSTTLAQSYSVLHHFAADAEGVLPKGRVVEGLDGALYGTTPYGGARGFGTVFKVSPDGGSYTVLKSFSGDDGVGPLGRLTLAGTVIYGITSHGGISNCGTVFKLNVDGSSYTVLKHFTWNDGIYPNAGLALYGATLYGATDWGGISSNGTVFKMNVDGSGYTVLLDRGGGNLLLTNGTLFGSGNDEIFKVNTDGSGYAVLKRNLNGGVGSLVLSSSTLYGTRGSMADFDGGSVFRINTDGTGFTNIGVFPHPIPGVNLPKNPLDLALAGTTLFGVADGGGDSGVVFWVSTTNAEGSLPNGFAALPSDGGLGRNPNSVTLVGSNLVGTAQEGGPALLGTLFRFNIYDQSFSALWHFGGNDGKEPEGGLTLSGGTLFGTTYWGGAYNMGTVFRIDTNGSNYTVLKEFHGDDGAGPGHSANLVLSGNTFYGTTQGGIYDGKGVMFRLNTDGSEYSVLGSFGSGGCGPCSLVLSGAMLYGVTRGCGTAGTIFRLGTNGDGYTTLKSFAYTNGSDPCLVVVSGATLYGITASGGAFDLGTVFKINTDGSGYALLKSFEGGAYGSRPSSLVLSDGTLYGTTKDTGTGLTGPGTIFKMNTDGGGYTILKTFNYSDGNWPTALVISGSMLYGATSEGGSEWHYGVIFQLNTNGGDYAVIKDFFSSDGSDDKTLLLSGTTLYGTANSGGPINNGVVFSLSIAPPAIVTPPQSQTVELGSAVRFTFTAGSAPFICRWFLETVENGKNLVACSTNCELLLTNVSLPCAGTYSFVLSNIFGAVTSAPVMLQVIPPVERRPVPAISLTGDPGTTLHVEYVDTLGLPSNWLPLGTVILSNVGQFSFDATDPLPPQRFYRAWQSETPVVFPFLQLPYFVPAITLTGSIGDTVRLDCINAIGPIDAWVTLDTITLTNTSQLYFDTSGPWNPGRLYRIVPVP